MTEPASRDALSLVERARALAPLLAEDAAEAERLRRPTDRVIAALREARVFDLMVPRCHGGLELDLDAFVEVGLALGRGDASMAWVASFYIEHNWMLCQFPEAFQKELYAEADHVLAPAALNGQATVEAVDGGYRVDGRWSWGTGAMHADWVLVASLVAGEGGLPDMRMFAAPAAEVEIDDVWHVDGMAGTGSNDLLLHDCFVPAERTVSVIEMGEGRGLGASLHPAPLYRTPMIPILVLAASMPAVGQARAALDRFVGGAAERVRYANPMKQAEKPAVQMRLGRAALEVGIAEEALRRIAREVMERRDGATRADRARWMAEAAHAVHLSRGVLESLADVAGGSAHFQSHPLQRAVRDLRTLSAHVVFDLDARLELHGRAQLGLEVTGLL